MVAAMRTALPFRTRLLSAALLALGSFAACASEDESVVVPVVPSVILPKGILDQVTSIGLRVYDASAGVTCNLDDGQVAGNVERIVTEAQLSAEGCAEGVRFCGTLRVRRSTTPYIFAASAVDDGGRLLAAGCLEDRIDEPRRDLTIQMRRYLEPALCGNQNLEPTELCDPPDTDKDPKKLVCDDACKTVEVYLSEGSPASPGGTDSGKAGDKERPALVWSRGSGADHNFLAFFTDKTPSTREVTMRVRSHTFGRFTSSAGDEISDYSFFLPHDPQATLPPEEQPFDQAAPVAVRVGNRTWIAFEDDSDGLLNVDIRLRSIDSSFVSEQPTGAYRVNGTTTAGEPGAQTLPAMAASSDGVLFVAWQDEDGSIRGRTVTPGSPPTLGSPRTLDTGPASRNVRVAGRGAGYVAVWEAGSEIRMAILNPDGIGTPQKVNGENRTGPVSHPDVAVLADGRFAVTFGDRGDIFLQRFDKDGKPLAGNQDARVNDLVADGDQHSPVIAAMPAAGGSYAVAWLDDESDHIRGVYLGGDAGVLFNPSDAQASEFQMSIVGGHGRGRPAIVVGGANPLPAGSKDPPPFVVVAWEDLKADGRPGIYGRRFLLPLE